MSRSITKISPAKAETYANGSLGDLARRSNKSATIDRTSLLSERSEWEDAEYRHAYAEAAVEQGIAWQIRVNRQARGLSQQNLAQQLGTRQSAISRLEDPEHGGYSLPTLLRIAKSFDCALMVRFVPYSWLAWEAQHLGPADLYAAPYSEEIHHDALRK